MIHWRNCARLTTTVSLVCLCLFRQLLTKITFHNVATCIVYFIFMYRICRNFNLNPTENKVNSTFFPPSIPLLNTPCIPPSLLSTLTLTFTSSLFPPQPPSSLYIIHPLSLLLAFHLPLYISASPSMCVFFHPLLQSISLTPPPLVFHAPVHPSFIRGEQTQSHQM